MWVAKLQKQTAQRNVSGKITIQNNTVKGHWHNYSKQIQWNITGTIITKKKNSTVKCQWHNNKTKQKKIQWNTTGTIITKNGTVKCQWHNNTQIQWNTTGTIITKNSTVKCQWHNNSTKIQGSITGTIITKIQWNISGRIITKKCSEILLAQL